jgi:ABC-type glutathione transport system ATPase component
MLLISHDLAVVECFRDTVMGLYLGLIIVPTAAKAMPGRSIPTHALLSAIPIEFFDVDIETALAPTATPPRQRSRATTSTSVRCRLDVDTVRRHYHGVNGDEVPAYEGSGASVWEDVSVSARSSPISSCTTSSISGLTNGVAAKHAVMS